LIYSDLAAFFLVVLARGFAGAFAGALAGALLALFDLPGMMPVTGGDHSLPSLSAASFILFSCGINSLIIYSFINYLLCLGA
jgi:hypothetical protein